MTTVSTSFTDVGVSATLSVVARGEVISVAISGTYGAGSITLERALTPAESAWETVLGPYTTADATVAADYLTTRRNERFRLRQTVDNTGTAVTTISDGVKNLGNRVDDEGNVLLERTQAGQFFKEVLNAELRSVVNLTAATYTLSRALHAGRVLTLDRSGGIDINLPNATGSGAEYEFIVITATADAYLLDAFTIGADLVYGMIAGVDDEAEFNWGAEAGADNSVVLGGTAQATGGSIGDRIIFTDVAAGIYAVHGQIHHGSGTEANPFATQS